MPMPRYLRNLDGTAGKPRLSEGTMLSEGPVNDCTSARLGQSPAPISRLKYYTGWTHRYFSLRSYTVGLYPSKTLFEQNGCISVPKPMTVSREQVTPEKTFTSWTIIILRGYKSNTRKVQEQRPYQNQL